MASVFNIKEKNVKELFDGETIYLIPKYQRPYAWEKNHVKTLWDDVLDTYKQAQTFGNSFPGYFIGAMYTRELPYGAPELKEHMDVLKETEISPGVSPIKFIEVMDGQQRLTTLFLLRQFLGYGGGMIRLNDGSDVPAIIPSLQDRSFFFDMTMGRNPVPKTISQKKIKAAKEFFSNLTMPTSLNPAMLNHVVDSLFRITDHSLIDPKFAIQIFQAQNDRGKQLTYLERLKSLLMLHDYRECRMKNQNQIEEVFSRMYRALDESMHLGVFSEGEPGENSFLEVLFVMLRIGYDAEAMWHSTKDVYEYYFRHNLSKNDENDTEDVCEELASLSTCKIIEFWTNELDCVVKVLAALNTNLNNASFKEEYSLLFNALGSEFKGINKRTKAILFKLRSHYGSPPDWHDKLLKVDCLSDYLKKCFQEAIDDVRTRYQSEWLDIDISDLFEKQLNDLTNRVTKLYNSKKSVSLLDIAKWMDLAIWQGNPKKTFSNVWSFIFLKNNCASIQDAAMVIWDRLIWKYRESYIQNLMTITYPRGLEFILKEAERIRRSHNIHDVARYELHLEHILPRTPSFPAKDVGFKQDEYKEELYSLGNLIFCDKEVNSQVQNNPPYFKAPVYLKQLAQSGVKVKHVMGELTPIGESFQAVYKTVGTSSPLYRACLRLRQIDLALFVAESI